MSWACDPAITSTVLDSFQGVGPMFVQSVQTFLAAQCALTGDHLWPPDATDAVIQDPEYDFIVVGSGSAGSVVANRLSEVTGWKVLLVEAGGNPTITTEAPLLFYNNLDSPEDWGYRIQSQGVCRGYKENRCAWPRGKVLGGCSSINGMFYVRGNKADYDEWAAAGNLGWSYEEVFKYFKKSQNFTSELTEDIKEYHGTGGYLSVENDPNIHIFEEAILKANNELGFKTLSDVNGDSQIGVAKAFCTIKNGVRQSTARAFLSPIKDRKNFHVIKNALATKVLFKPNTNIASGIVIHKNGKEITVNAKKEVILSAGAINTPQLLMLSGIGPSKHLQELNINVKADLPVGENLQDHVFVPFYFSFPGPKNLTSIENVAKQFISYITEQKGAFSNISPHRIIAFYNTADASSTIPDVQFHFLVFPPGLFKIVDVLAKHKISDEIQKQYRKINEDNFVMIIYAVLLRPESKGKILLKSNDPYEHPLIYANYFEKQQDLQTVMRGIKDHILRFGDTQVFKNMGIKSNVLELDECRKYAKDSDDFVECYSKQMTFSLYHPSGTAKMGPLHESSTVVDPELRVKNIERLRVADASIMPNIVRGNTNAPTIMIGEKCADMIKQTWLQGHTEL
ncbi:glucose dehydrogenase [FAD, quinone]-like [Ostrinia nubilalis]|uniref:glucose dehydrogenase [FAD, quinone]-like n=1 Tax=Ostrinia nubilalis TaxID=29057 RepID=UPI00308263E4